MHDESIFSKTDQGTKADLYKPLKNERIPGVDISKKFFAYGNEMKKRYTENAPLG